MPPTRKRPRIAKGPASAYQAPNEIIREWSAGAAGGLLSIRVLDGGQVIVEIYHTNGDITVHLDSNVHVGEHKPSNERAETCDECGAATGALVSAEHEPSCSLHPANAAGHPATLYCTNCEKRTRPADEWKDGVRCFVCGDNYTCQECGGDVDRDGKCQRSHEEKRS